MTNLTKQWKKRTLRNGAYYIKMLGGDILPAFCNTEYILKQFQTMKGIYDDTAEVLAPVPTFEEWQQLKEEVSRESYKVSEAYCLVEELKELLKECESSIQYYQETYGAMDLDTYTLLAKLNEAIK